MNVKFIANILCLFHFNPQTITLSTFFQEINKCPFENCSEFPVDQYGCKTMCQSNQIKVLSIFINLLFILIISASCAFYMNLI